MIKCPRRYVAGATIAAAIALATIQPASALPIANGSLTIVPAIGAGAVTVNTGNITLTTSSKHEPALVVQTVESNLTLAISAGNSAILSNSTLVVPAGTGVAQSVNFTLTISGIVFTFDTAITDSRVALNVATNTAGSFAEQFTGTLTNGNGIFATGTPVALSESCTQAVVSHHAGLISCANSVVTFGGNEVPEPASLAILAASLLGFGVLRRRKQA